MTKWSRSVGRHNRRKIYICPMHHKNELGLHQSGLVLAFLYLCFVLLAFVFLLHKTQHNSTHRTPNNGVTTTFCSSWAIRQKKYLEDTHTRSMKDKTFFFFFGHTSLCLPWHIPLNSTQTNPFFSNKGLFSIPIPRSLFFQTVLPFVHSFASFVRQEDGKWKQETTTYAATPQDTHKGYS